MRGRMPVTKVLPYQWYDTPNIRVATFADFLALAKKNQLHIKDAFGLQDEGVVRWWPNARATLTHVNFRGRVVLFIC